MLGRTLGTAVAVAGASVAALLAYAFLPTLFGAEALIVTSGSMGQAVPVGSVAVTRVVDAGAIGVGDVITFKAPGGRTSITHRVVEMHLENGQRILTTKGDANPAPDPEPVYVSDRMHRVERVVPYAGRVVAFARTPGGAFALLLAPILGLIADRRRSGRVSPPLAAQPPRATAPPTAPARSAEPVAAFVGGVLFGMIAFRLAGRAGRKRPRLAG